MGHLHLQLRPFGDGKALVWNLLTERKQDSFPPIVVECPLVEPTIRTIVTV